ncbi:hypothetical protein TruAng_001227 [Truncatella angustata]|nr:hypothetical protein TruAng_001227 [Truncatella angustata]
MHSKQLPDFDDLPLVEGMPQGCAWGVFDKDGKKDLLGTLNLLTPDVVAAACSEAREGVSISLNWPLDSSKLPSGRMKATHKHMTLKETGLSEMSGWDDELQFNTQVSSQWDSLVHWQHQESDLAYNGVKVTHDALAAPTTAANKMPTLDHWHQRGGLVARGVLIDFKDWYETKATAEGRTGDDIICHPLDGYRITVDDIETIAREQNVQFKHGDVLIIRTGLTEVLEDLQPADWTRLSNPQISGMHGSLESAKWLWNKHFAAVAGDAIAFEALMPLKEDGSPGSPSDLGLVGSPPNALAIF